MPISLSVWIVKYKRVIPASTTAAVSTCRQPWDTVSEETCQETEKNTGNRYQGDANEQPHCASADSSPMQATSDDTKDDRSKEQRFDQIHVVGGYFAWGAYLSLL